VTIYPFPDPYKKNKDANLINKILFACSIPGISQTFLNFSDDQYVLKPVSEFLTPGSNHLHKPDSKAKWHLRMNRTLDALGKAGYSTNCFEAHCPYPINKSLYQKVLMYNYGEGRGMCGNTLYFNTVGATPTEYDTTDKFDVDAT